MINPMDLSGKKYMVTGASSGIGRATAKKLASLGARVALVGRNEGRLQEVLAAMEGEGHKAYPFDLANADGVVDLVQRMAMDGLLDGMAYCAGIGNSYPLKMTKPDKLELVMQVNLYAFIELSRLLTSKRYGNPPISIVGVSSTASHVGDKGLTAYCASKAGMDGAVRAMARELGPSGARVNTVLPGWTRTELVERTFAECGEERCRVELATRQFMGMIPPEETANAIAFLLSDAARFITGVALPVDGGYLS